MCCMGNICRSPIAEAVLRRKLADAGLADLIEVDSAGTHGHRIGAPSDERAVAHAARRGYDLSALRARRVEAGDFHRHDWILAMDEQNLADLSERCPPANRRRLRLLLDTPTADFAAAREVPDPYYGGPAGFEHVLDLVEPACEALVRQLARIVGSADSSIAATPPIDGETGNFQPRSRPKK